MQIFKSLIILLMVTVLFIGCQNTNKQEANAEKCKALLIGTDSDLSRVFQSEKASVTTDSEISEYDEFNVILVNSKYIDRVDFEKLRIYIESGKDAYFYNLLSTEEIEKGLFGSENYETIKEASNDSFEIARIYLGEAKNLQMVQISCKYDEKNPDSLFKNLLMLILKYTNL